MMLTNIVSNSAKYKNYSYGTHKPQGISFSAAKIKSLNEDTVQFRGASTEQTRYINKDDIPQMVEKFAKELENIDKFGLFNPLQVQLLIDDITNGLPIEVHHHDDPSLINSFQACAFATSIYDKGNIEKVYIVINFNDHSLTMLSQIIHEFTHALQSYTQEKSDMIHRLYRDKSGPENYEKAYYIFDTKYNILERKISADPDNLKVINEIIKRFQLKMFSSIGSKRKEKYNEFINKALSEYGITNKKLALEYFKQMYDDEAQAYKEDIKFLKKITNKQNEVIIEDLDSKMREDVSSYLDELIKQEEAKGHA